MNIPTRLKLVWAIVFVLVPSFATGQDTLVDAYADAIKSLLDKHLSEGEGAMVIGLIDEHGSRVFSAGQLDNGTDKEVDGDTIFELGSVTKVFTSLLLLESVQRGEVKLDDPVARYLPASVTMPSYDGKEITLLNLAVQDSGLPWHPHSFSANGGKPALLELREAANAYQANDLYEFLSTVQLASAPGTEFQYSNVGMALLGHALERKIGADYELLVVDRICQPLAMGSTRISLTADQKTRFARGHWADGEPAENMNFQVMRPAGSLLSTGNDLLKFLSANLGLGDSPLTPLMMQTQVIRHTNHIRFGKTAMPWFDERVYNPPGTEILAHGGGGFGYLAFLGIDKSKRRGVVVLTSQLAFSPNGIGWTLLQGLPLTHENITYFVREIVALGFALETNKETGLPQIKTVWPKSPAGKARLHPGITITKINGARVEGKSLQQCISMMAGPIGTKVQLEIVDTKQETTRTVKLTREKFLTVTGESHNGE